MADRRPPPTPPMPHQFTKPDGSIDQARFQTAMADFQEKMKVYSQQTSMPFLYTLGTQNRTVNDQAFQIGTTNQDAATQQAAAANQRQAAQATGAQVDGSQQGQVRNAQTDLLGALQARAMGQGGPSAAELQMKAGQQENLRQS